MIILYVAKKITCELLNISKTTQQNGKLTAFMFLVEILPNEAHKLKVCLYIFNIAYIALIKW